MFIYQPIISNKLGEELREEGAPCFTSETRRRLRVAGVRLEAGEDSSVRRDAGLALRLVLDEHIRPRPAATQAPAAPRVRRLGLRLGLEINQ